MINLPPIYRGNDVTVTPWSEQSCGLSFGNVVGVTPNSGTYTTAQRTFVYPLRLYQPMVVQKAFVLNGATISTDSWDVGVYRMTDMTTGRLDLIRSTGAIQQAGSANACQDTATWRVARRNLTAAGDSVDRDTYTTASVVLKTGRLYCLAVENSHLTSAPAVTSVTGGATWVERATVQFNGTLNRVSLWTCSPASDYAGTISIAFGTSSGVTGAVWALDEMSGVDTSSNDGIVQTVTATGSSTTPTATLAAFASTSNATYGIHGKAANATSTPGTGFTELSDTGTGTPAQSISTEWRVDNDTSVDFTITSAAWGCIAAEVKADTSPFIIPAQSPGTADIYMAMTNTGTSATYFSVNMFASQAGPAGIMMMTLTNPALPSSGFVATIAFSAQRIGHVFGFSSRTLLG